MKEQGRELQPSHQAHSKPATVALMDAFAREYPETTFRSAGPGAVKTPMAAGEGMPRMLVPVRNLFFSSPDKAARRIHDGGHPDHRADNQHEGDQGPSVGGTAT